MDLRSQLSFIYSLYQDPAVVSLILPSLSEVCSITSRLKTYVAFFLVNDDLELYRPTGILGIQETGQICSIQFLWEFKCFSTVFLVVCRIYNLQPSDSGRYVCTATSDAGTVTDFTVVTTDG